MTLAELNSENFSNNNSTSINNETLTTELLDANRLNLSSSLSPSLSSSSQTSPQSSSDHKSLNLKLDSLSYSNKNKNITINEDEKYVLTTSDQNGINGQLWKTLTTNFIYDIRKNFDIKDRFSLLIDKTNKSIKMDELDAKILENSYLKKFLNGDLENSDTNMNDYFSNAFFNTETNDICQKLFNSEKIDFNGLDVIGKFGGN